MELSMRRPDRRAVLVASVLLVALVVALAVHNRTSGPSRPDSGLGLSVSDNDPSTPMTSTRFRVATFNVLGAGHTVNSTKWEDGVTRMGYTVRLFRSLGLSVVGVQEMRRVQYDELKRLTGTEWAAWPGTRYHEASLQNSVVWKRAEWMVMRKETIRIPYLRGNEIRMPYVLLKHRTTGQRVWFSNFHNPADAHGDAEQWRDEATRRQLSLVRQLRADFPGVPVFYMGDFNEREEIFKKTLSKTDLYAANGGGRRSDGTWQLPPRPMPVDWIFGSRDIAMTGYRALRTALVQKASDHPLVTTDVTVPTLSSQASPVNRVVLVSVAGLRSGAFRAMSESDLGGLGRMRSGGASTLNARTTPERTTQLPNDVSMLTGRRVAARRDGHGVGTAHDPGGTVHQRAGRYTSSVMDLVSNFGGSAAVFSQVRQLDLVDRTWNEINGGRDPHQLDDGRDKIRRHVHDGSGGRLTRKVVRDLSRSPKKFTFVQLHEPARIGTRFGFGSTSYEGAVRRTGSNVGRILDAVGANPRTRGRTLVVVVGSHGGSGRDFDDRTRLGNAQVPFLVWGPGVERGGDLYALNPHYTNPRRDIPGFTGPQPIRTLDAANLALMALRLPAVPGSRANTPQWLNPYAGQ